MEKQPRFYNKVHTEAEDMGEKAVFSLAEYIKEHHEKLEALRKFEWSQTEKTNSGSPKERAEGWVTIKRENEEVWDPYRRKLFAMVEQKSDEELARMIEEAKKIYKDNKPEGTQKPNMDLFLSMAFERLAGCILLKRKLDSGDTLSKYPNPFIGLKVESREDNLYSFITMRLEDRELFDKRGLPDVYYNDKLFTILHDLGIKPEELPDLMPTNKYDLETVKKLADVCYEMMKRGINTHGY